MAGRFCPRALSAFRGEAAKALEWETDKKPSSAPSQLGRPLLLVSRDIVASPCNTQSAFGQNRFLRRLYCGCAMLYLELITRY